MAPDPVWVDAGQLVGVGQATLRRRRDEWIAVGAFDALVEEAIAGYDRIRDLDLSEVSVDGSIHEAPCGGDGTGPNPTDRAKNGWKWSIASEAAGIPIGWAIDGANRHDLRLLGPTLDTVTARGLDLDIDTLHLDRGSDPNTVRTELASRHIDDAVIVRRRRRGQPKVEGRRPLLLGQRWTVERTNSWLSNHGQLRRNTDRSSAHRLAQLALAIVLIIAAKLIDWHDRSNPSLTSLHRRHCTPRRPRQSRRPRPEHAARDDDIRHAPTPRPAPPRGRRQSIPALNQRAAWHLLAQPLTSSTTSSRRTTSTSCASCTPTATSQRASRTDRHLNRVTRGWSRTPASPTQPSSG